MSVSLIIVTHNSRDDIVACLEAVRGQQGVEFETIVVDNGSSDGTPAQVRSLFPEVALIEQENRGFGAGNNRGVQAAKGDVLVFLNPDTIPEPGFIEALAEAAVPGQVATAQVVLKDNPDCLNTAGHRLHFTGFGFAVGLRQPRWPRGPARPTQGFSGAAFAMRHEDFLRLGGFDEDFFLYMEDTELSWRLHRMGMGVVVAPSAVTLHEYSLEVPAAKIAHLEAGRLLLLRKHLPGHLWLAYLPSLLLAEALAWTLAIPLGRKGMAAKWRGLRAGCRRNIRTYRRLPRARPHEFVSRAIPFGMLSRRKTMWLFGGVVNAVFFVNTLTWSLRKKSASRV